MFTEPPSSYLPPHISSSGQGYHAIGSGYQDSEGANLDPQLLHKIKEILLDQENQVAFQYHGSYSPPIPLYGVPSSRVIG